MNSGCALANATVGVPYAELLSTSGGYAPPLGVHGQLPPAGVDTGWAGGLVPLFANAFHSRSPLRDSRSG